jgi:hypothetical protein
MLLSKGPPYYTHEFGAMGATLETARQNEFFQWFHMKETERRVEEPGKEARFRPSGDMFHSLCYLDILMGTRGELVRMELVVQRDFLDGSDRLFAQDLVKSFLMSVLPPACQHVLREFMEEINVPGGEGKTLGYLVFRGKQNAWRVQTGWTRLTLANLPLLEAAAFIVHVYPNPKAPNAVLIGEKPGADDADKDASEFSSGS